MKITEKTATLMLNSIAFTLTQVFSEVYEQSDPEKFTEKLNDTTRELFCRFCECEGIKEVEVEEV